MHVDIGPYSDSLIPVNRWEHAYTSWRHNEYYLDEDKYDWIDKLIIGFLDKLDNLVLPINRWSSNRARKVKIKIDNYDVWGAHHTLALVIHPVLVKLKECQKGSSTVEDSDVPVRLYHTDPPSETNGYIGDLHDEQWNWVLDEMIWAFKQCTNDGENTDQFHHNSSQLDISFQPIPGTLNSSLEVNRQKDLTKPAYWVDDAGKKAHYERIANGLRLFAKYYLALWD